MHTTTLYDFYRTFSSVPSLIYLGHIVMGAYFTLIGCPYITSVELVDVSDMLYIGGSLYISAH